MAQLLALEWDGREARIALATKSPGGIVIEQAFSVELGSRGAGEASAEPDVGERLASALASRGIGRVDTIVAVGRASIELRVLNVPPVPEAELPDIVRFQAMRQFTALGDDWPLDFVVLDQVDEGINVLAATISPDLVRQIQNTCAASQLTPRRLVLRPFAGAALLRSRGHSTGCVMMVDLLAEEADLTVIVDQQVVFMRTIRRPVTDEIEYAIRTLVGEIRRTIVAAQNQLRGRTVERIVLCGVAESNSHHKAAFESQIGLESELLNPFEMVRLGPELRRSPPDFPGRFAPLLGMLLDEAAGTAHTIDFLNPRRRPEKPTQIRRNSLIGAAACLVLFCVAWILWSISASQHREIQALQATRAKLKADEPAALDLIKRAEELDKWSAGDINWLDELREISTEFPPADQTIVTQLTARAQPEGGRLSFDGVATESSIIETIGKAIEDEFHSPKGDGPWPSKLVEGYDREFQETVTVLKHDAKAAAKKSAASAASVEPTKKESAE